MGLVHVAFLAGVLTLGLSSLFGNVLGKQLRKRRYFRGRKLGTLKAQTCKNESLLFGTQAIPRALAKQHFLFIGTTGSGKTLLQRQLLAPVLSGICPGKDQRALIFDAKNDIVPYLVHIGVTCPIYSLNPLETRDANPIACSWNIAADIQSPARALNLVANLIPAEKGGANQYFTDSARHVVTAVCESFIRHSPTTWEFSDLVFATLCQERIREILRRDAPGREVLDGFFRDERTAYQVFTTIYSRMGYFRPVAAMWQRASKSISLSKWLKTNSILLIGSNATVKTALDAINEQIVRVVVEEIDEQRDSKKRETWLWIDEARLAGPLLKSGILSQAAVKARSRGGCLVLGIQDIEGFREAAGTRLANEIVAQCSHKALLRMEGDESAKFASSLVGSFETIEWFKGESGKVGCKTQSESEQRVTKQAVLPSEFYNIPVTNKRNGLTGFFLSPTFGAIRSTVPGRLFEPQFVPEEVERYHAFSKRKASEQTLRSWEVGDRCRLCLEVEKKHDDLRERKQLKLKRLRRGHECSQPS